MMDLDVIIKKAIGLLTEFYILCAEETESFLVGGTKYSRDYVWD